MDTVEFKIARLVLLVEYSVWAILALFVSTWWGGTVIRNYCVHRRLQQVDWLMIGVSVMAGATCISRLLWLPGHYYQGIGEPMEAAQWSLSIDSVLGVTNILVIIGLALHVKTAWTDGSKGLIFSLLFIGFIFMMLIWWMIGGFGFRYV